MLGVSRGPLRPEREIASHRWSSVRTNTMLGRVVGWAGDVPHADRTEADTKARSARIFQDRMPQYCVGTELSQ